MPPSDSVSRAAQASTAVEPERFKVKSAVTHSNSSLLKNCRFFSSERYEHRMKDRSKFHQICNSGADDFVRLMFAKLETVYRVDHLDELLEPLGRGALRSKSCLLPNGWRDNVADAIVSGTHRGAVSEFLSILSRHWRRTAMSEMGYYWQQDQPEVWEHFESIMNVDWNALSLPAKTERCVVLADMLEIKALPEGLEDFVARRGTTMLFDLLVGSYLSIADNPRLRELEFWEQVCFYHLLDGVEVSVRPGPCHWKAEQEYQKDPSSLFSLTRDDNGFLHIEKGGSEDLITWEEYLRIARVIGFASLETNPESEDDAESHQSSAGATPASESEEGDSDEDVEEVDMKTVGKERKLALDKGELRDVERRRQEEEKKTVERQEPPPNTGGLPGAKDTRTKEEDSGLKERKPPPDVGGPPKTKRAKERFKEEDESAAHALKNTSLAERAGTALSDHESDLIRKIRAYSLSPTEVERQLLLYERAKASSQSAQSQAAVSSHDEFGRTRSKNGDESSSVSGAPEHRKMVRKKGESRSPFYALSGAFFHENSKSKSGLHPPSAMSQEEESTAGVAGSPIHLAPSNQRDDRKEKRRKKNREKEKDDSRRASSCRRLSDAAIDRVGQISREPEMQILAASAAAVAVFNGYGLAPVVAAGATLLSSAALLRFRSGSRHTEDDEKVASFIGHNGDSKQIESPPPSRYKPEEEGKRQNREEEKNNGGFEPPRLSERSSSLSGLTPDRGRFFDEQRTPTRGNGKGAQPQSLPRPPASPGELVFSSRFNRASPSPYRRGPHSSVHPSFFDRMLAWSAEWAEAHDFGQEQVRDLAAFMWSSEGRRVGGLRRAIDIAASVDYMLGDMSATVKFIKEFREFMGR